MLYYYIVSRAPESLIICVPIYYFFILGSHRAVVHICYFPHIRGTTNAGATWHESSHAIMVHWACWDGIRMDSRPTWCRLDFLCSCSNLMSRGGIQTGQTQIWQQRLPEANHVKVRTDCQVVSPPSIFPSFKLSVALVFDRVASLFISSLKNTSQSRAHRGRTARCTIRTARCQWSF